MPVDFTSVLVALANARARFVVAGGLAMLLHGFDRLTADIDVAIDLNVDAGREAIAVLLSLGYRPMAPVDAMELADPAIRNRWRSERSMVVFSFWDPTHSRPTIDVLLDPPVPFERLWKDSTGVRIGDASVRIASREHLIEMKTASGRPQDLVDVENLRKPR